jgi:phospholipid/cholesterol/gamma-HCH transport system substrate-binding protein
MLPLKHKAEDLLKELDEAIKTVRLIFNEKTRLDIQRSVGHFTSSTKNIVNITKMVDTIVRNKGGDIEQILADIRSLTGTLKSSNNDIQRILHNFSSTSDSLSKVSFKHTFDLLEGTLATINTTVQKLEQGEGTVGQLMKNDSLYKSLLETTQSLNKLTIEFTENPKKYINFSVFDLGKSDKKRKENR